MPFARSDSMSKFCSAILLYGFPLNIKIRHPNHIKYNPLDVYKKVKILRELFWNWLSSKSVSCILIQISLTYVPVYWRVNTSGSFVELNKGKCLNCRTISTYLSHPSLGWLYVFSSFPPPHPRPPPPQWLLLLTSKPFELHLRYLGQRKYRSRKMYWTTILWPWPKVTAVSAG